jgi:hypothetical protein
MTDIATLGLEVKSDGVVTATSRLDDLSAAGKRSEAGASSLGKTFDNLGYSLDSLQGLIMQAVAALALMKLAEHAKEAAMLAARYETLGVVVKVIGGTAGYTKTQMDGFQASLQKTGISAIEARQGLALMGQAQIDFANSSKLARIAQDAAVIGNINSSEAFNRMMTGLATGQSIILHHLGLMTNFEDAYIKAAHAAGKTTKDLTEVEKAQIRVNEVVRAGTGIAGSYEAAMTTVGKQITSLPRYISDLMVAIGSMGQGALFDLVSGLTTAIKWVTKNLNEIVDAVEIVSAVILAVFVSKALAGAITALTTMAGAAKAAAFANGGLALSTGAVSTGMTAAAASTELMNKALTFMGGPLGITIGLITAAAGAWMAYINAKSKAIDQAAAAEDGLESNRLARENQEIREKIRLMKQSESDKIIEKESQAQGKLVELKKQEAILQAIINTQDFEGGDIYGEKTEAAQKRLDTIKREIALLPSLSAENARLAAEQKKLIDSKKEKNPGTETVGPDHYAEELRKSHEEYIKYSDEFDKRVLAGKKNQSDLELQELKDLNALKLINDRDYAAQRAAIQLKQDQEAEASATHRFLLAVQFANYEKSLLDKAGKDSTGAYKGDVTGYNKANTQEEQTRKEQEAASAKVQLQTQEIENMGGINRLLDVRFVKESAIQRLEILGRKDNAQDLANEIKYQDLLDKGIDKELVALIKSNDALKRQLELKKSIEESDNHTQELKAAMMVDPYEKQMAMMDLAYEKEKKIMDDRLALSAQGSDLEKSQLAELTALREKYEGDRAQIQKDKETSHWDQALTTAKKNAPQLAALDGFLAIQHKKYEADKNDSTKLSTKGQLNMTADYVDAAGGMFGALAQTMDKSSRDGFETAKALNIAQAVMSTAAGIMRAYSDLGPIAGTVAAVVIAATGAMQIAQIASTSFGGAATAPSVSAGSFSGGSAGQGGSVGGSIGGPINSVHDTQSEESLRNIAASMQSASLAIGKVADGLTKVADLFAKGGFLSRAGGALSSDALSTVKGPGLMSKLKDSILTPGLLDFSSLKGLLATSIGNSILPGLGNLFGGMFGGGKSLVGQGINLSLQGGQVSAQNYANIKTNGGWFGSDHTNTSYSTNADAQNAMQAALNSIVSTINRSVVAMGTSVNLGAANLGNTQISTAGRTSDDINKDIQAWMEKASNELAKNVTGLQQFAFYGENAFDALVRLSTALQSSNEGLELIGHNLIDSTMAGANMAFKLQDLMGGADKFSSKLDDYFSAMFTDKEQAAAKAAQAQRQVNVAFAEMGRTVPPTKAAFKEMVNALDLSTAAGASTFAALMDVATAFATVQDQIKAVQDATRAFSEDLAIRAAHLAGQDTTLLELRLQQEAEMRKAVENGMDVNALKIIQDGEWAEAVKKATAAVGAAIVSLADAAKTAAMNMVDAQIALANSMKGIMTGPAAQLSPEAAYLQAKAEFDKIKNSTKLEDIQAMPQVANALLAASKNYNASGTGYQSDLAEVLAKMNGMLGGTGDPTLITIESQLKVLQDIRTALTSGALITELGPNGTLAGLIATWNAATAAKLLSDRQAAADQTLARLQPALTAVTSAKSTMAAITPMFTDGSVASYGGNAGTATMLSGILSDVQKRLNDSIAARTAANPSDYAEWDARIAGQRADLDMWQKQFTYYDTASKLPALIATLQPLLDYYRSLLGNGVVGTVPSFAVGSSFIPRDMLANIHYGEAVIDSPSMNVLRKYGVPTSGSADNRETIVELKNLLAESRAQTKVLQAGLGELINEAKGQSQGIKSQANAARLAVNQ